MLQAPPRRSWAGLALLLTLLAPFTLTGSVWMAFVAMAGLLALLLSSGHQFRDWLILTALGLTLLPALYILLVLAKRAAGAPAELTVWAPLTQRTPILAEAVVCTVVFAAAMALGWVLGASRHQDRANAAPSVPYISPPATVLLIAVWAFALWNFDLQSGRSIFSIGYGSLLNQGSALVYSGLWAVICNMSLLVLEQNRAEWQPLVRMLISLLWLTEFAVFLLHGNRVDLLAGLLILFLVRIRGFWRQAVMLALAGLLAVPLLTFFSVFREMASSGTISFSSMLQRSTTILDQAQNVGDLGDFAVTTCAGIYMIESGRAHLLAGSSYLRYLARLTPTFLRPYGADDGGRIFNAYGLHTNGGMTPVAEAYFNFGILGPVLVGWVAGMLLAGLGRLRHSPSRFAWSSMYLLAIAYSLRAFFYDPFDLIKAELVFACYLGAVSFLTIITSSDRRSSRGLGLPDQWKRRILAQSER